MARLEVQGRALAPATRMILAEAGIRPGMRVLDLGCGPGDVTFVAADLVGPDGSVVGIDRSAEGLARARLRAGQRDLTQVQFVEGDIRSWVLEAFAKVGIAGLGPRLWAVVEEAGLRPLGMIGIQPHFGPGDEVGFAFTLENLRAATQLIEGTGVATAEEIGMDTLEQRMRGEAERVHPMVGASFMLLSAWATTGRE